MVEPVTVLVSCVVLSTCMSLGSMVMNSGKFNPKRWWRINVHGHTVLRVGRADNSGLFYALSQRLNLALQTRPHIKQLRALTYAEEVPSKDPTDEKKQLEDEKKMVPTSRMLFVPDYGTELQVQVWVDFTVQYITEQKAAREEKRWCYAPVYIKTSDKDSVEAYEITADLDDPCSAAAYYRFLLDLTTQLDPPCHPDTTAQLQKKLDAALLATISPRDRLRWGSVTIHSETPVAIDPPADHKNPPPSVLCKRCGERPVTCENDRCRNCHRIAVKHWYQVPLFVLTMYPVVGQSSLRRE